MKELWYCSCQQHPRRHARTHTLLRQKYAIRQWHSGIHQNTLTSHACTARTHALKHAPIHTCSDRTTLGCCIILYSA